MIALLIGDQLLQTVSMSMYDRLTVFFEPFLWSRTLCSNFNC